MGHFGVDKTLGLLKEKFFWPHMTKDVQRHCNRCISCLQSDEGLSCSFLED